jgi:hypothetical protein
MRVSKRISLLLAGLMVVALAVAPAAGAKKKNVTGSLLVSIPGFDQSSHTSLATGFVKAKGGCSAPRIVRFAYFNADGTPVQFAGQPTVVTAPGGSFIAALPQPSNSNDVAISLIVKVAVDGLAKKSKGKKVNCLPLTAPDTALTLPPNS